ncbi:MAG: ABC transporter ATP-binding protein/permease [Methylobacteriaceae bacterium]|nr:ABC transporter ATP-binding protein/permease [Methylobacteriaceae bacterium]
MTGAVLLLVLLSLVAQIGINRWNRFFFDALQRQDGAALLVGVGIIVGLAAAAAAAAVLLVHARMRLQVRWRQWLTNHLVGRWLSERRFYQLNIVENHSSNPEYRIAEDARLATEPLVEFFVGVTNAVLTAAAFLGILWAVGGGFAVAVGGVSFAVPGFFVWVAIAYSTICSVAMVMIGRPLARRVEAKNGQEARLRYELTRVRESAENIALIGGDEDERARIGETFADVAVRWFEVIRQQAKMTWIINGNSVLAPVVPLLVGYPKYLAGGLSLGELMQVATAFLQVQVALNYLVENAIRIAEWFASAQRVVELIGALDDLDATLGDGSGETIVLGDSADDSLRIEELVIRQSNGRLMIDAPEVTVPRGQKVLVKGQSGTGKSTLIRAIAGLWPWGSGRILRPKGARIAFMPQRPYIPLGTLRHALLYPGTDREAGDDELRKALKRCGLMHFADRLDDEEPWDRIMSGGEQQRLAFARLLIDPPDIIIMDESTSALDELSQERMLQLLHDELAAATVLNVGHRPGLEAYHDREISLVREPGQRHAVPCMVRAGLARRLLRRLSGRGADNAQTA